MVCISVVFSLHKDQLEPSEDGCQGGYLLKYYYLGLLAILACHLLLDIIIIIIASRGTIINPHARRHMPIFIYIKFLFYIPELAWTVFGTYWSFEKDTVEGCNLVVIWTVRVAALAGWVIMLALVIGLLIVFDPMGRQSGGRNIDSQAAKRVWERR